MKRLLHGSFIAVVALAFGLIAIEPAEAAWPERPITIIVGFAPGGTGDAIGRIIAPAMSKILGVSVIVENRAGADGVIGSGQVARSAPDGYTLLLATSSFTVNPALSDKLPFDTVKDFRPIGFLADAPAVVIVNAKQPEKTFLELIDRSRSSRIVYASSASNTYLATEFLKKLTGVQATPVPYKGAGPAMQAVLTGEVQFGFTGISNALPQIESGTVRALAITGAKRSALLPDVPTLAELGPAEWGRVDLNNWYSLYGPAGLPDDIAKRLNEVVNQSLRDPEVLALMKKLTVDARASTPQDLARITTDEVTRWVELAKEIGEPKR